MLLRIVSLLFLISCLAYSKCPLNGTEYNGKCYVYVPWGTAENYCRLQGGHLTSIHSQEENDFLLNTLLNVKNPVNSDGFFSYLSIGTYLVNGTWEWTDGTPYDFDNFDDTQDNPFCCATSPDNVPYCCGTEGNLILTAPEDLVPYIQGRWIANTGGFYSAPFICQLPLCDTNGQSAPSLIQPNTTAGTGIYYLQSSDSYFLAAGGADELSGEMMCNVMAAHLPSVHNAFQNSELINVMKNFGKGFFFYFDFGLRKDANSTTWYFTDGSPVSYVNWAPNHPWNDTKQLLTYIEPSTGYWYSEEYDSIWGPHHLGCQLKRNINLCQ